MWKGSSRTSRERRRRIAAQPLPLRRQANSAVAIGLAIFLTLGGSVTLASAAGPFTLEEIITCSDFIGELRVLSENPLSLCRAESANEKSSVGRAEGDTRMSLDQPVCYEIAIEDTWYSSPAGEGIVRMPKLRLESSPRLVVDEKYLVFAYRIREDVLGLSSIAPLRVEFGNRFTEPFRQYSIEKQDASVEPAHIYEVSQVKSSILALARESSEDFSVRVSRFEFGFFNEYSGYQALHFVTLHPLPDWECPPKTHYEAIAYVNRSVHKEVLDELSRGAAVATMSLRRVNGAILVVDIRPKENNGDAARSLSE